MEMPNRNGSSESYRFGFNGMEKDDETYGVSGTAYDFGARIYSSRLGRWLATDPLENKYLSLSPYNFVANSPLIYIDPNGKELVLGGQKDNAGKDIRNLVPESYRSKIDVNDSGDVKFNLSQETIDKIRAGNPDGDIDQGVVLLFNITDSKKKYKYEVSETSGKIRMVDDSSGKREFVEPNMGMLSGNDNGIENTSLTPRSGPEGDHNHGDYLPEEGYDGHLVMAPELDAWEPVEKGLSKKYIRENPGLEWEKKSRNSVLFHELSEMYNRTEGNQGKGMSYKEADKKAADSDKKGTYPGIGATANRVKQLGGTLKEKSNEE